MRSMIWRLSCSFLFGIALAIALSGCATEGGVYKLPVSDETVQGAVVATADSSVLKEAEVHVTLRNRDKMISADNAKPSFEITWNPIEETYQFPGMKEPVKLTRAFPDIKVTQKQQYTQPLPTEPSRHPVWTSVNRGLDVLERIGLGWILGEAHKTGVENAAPKYSGPYSPNTQSFSGSFNPVSTTTTGALP